MTATIDRKAPTQARRRRSRTFLLTVKATALLDAMTPDETARLRRLNAAAKVVCR